MSAHDDIKAALAANAAGIDHVKALLIEASERISAVLNDGGSDDELEAVASELREQAETLSGLTLVPPQTSGVPGAQTANGSPYDPVPSGADVPTPSDPSPLPDDADVAPPSSSR